MGPVENSPYICKLDYSTIDFDAENRPNLIQMFDQLNAMFFENLIPSISVEWNYRMRTCAGRAHYMFKADEYGLATKIIWPKSITMANRLFAKYNFRCDLVEETLVHEMAHHYLVVKTGKCQKHNKMFQDLMTRVTGLQKNHRLHAMDISDLRNKKRGRSATKTVFIDKNISHTVTSGILRQESFGSIVDAIKKNAVGGEYWIMSDL